MRHGKFGISGEKLNMLIESQWRQLDIFFLFCFPIGFLVWCNLHTNGNNEVSREEFKSVISTQKAFVNTLTLQVFIPSHYNITNITFSFARFFLCIGEMAAGSVPSQTHDYNHRKRLLG